MRKYSILVALANSPDGLSPSEISQKFGISVSNIYTYLTELEKENLVKRLVDGDAILNSAEPKVEIILNIHAMGKENFDQLISPRFGILLRKLAESLKTPYSELSQMENLRIKKTGIPNRIVLQISRRPKNYVLKVNEPLTKELLNYFGINLDFSEIDFTRLIDQLPTRRERNQTILTTSDPRAKEKCDKFHADGYDHILNRFTPFNPDEKVAPLLDRANLVNKEYSLFLNALDLQSKTAILERWQNGYIYNTNSIEGNTLTEEEVATVLIGKENMVNATAKEIHETNNMKAALRFLDLKKDEDVSIELMRELHFIVQNNIKLDAGHFKTTYNLVANEPTTPPEYVKEELDTLIQWYKKNKTMNPIVLASLFHMQFEVIHPFSDGNGRVGRLLLNHILVQNRFHPITILQKAKQDYYRGIRSQSLPMLLLHITSTFIEEYKRA